MRNNGDGTFGARVDYGVGNSPWGITFGDIDYVVSDVEGDSVRLRVEYSVNGVDRNRASIVGDTLVGWGGYEVLWATGVDLAGLVGNYYF